MSAYKEAAAATPNHHPAVIRMLSANGTECEFPFGDADDADEAWAWVLDMASGERDTYWPVRIGNELRLIGTHVQWGHA